MKKCAAGATMFTRACITLSAHAHDAGEVDEADLARHCPAKQA